MPRISVPTLVDGPVTLRAHAEDDLPRLLEQCRDPLSIAWTTVPVPYSPEDARRFVRDVMPGGWASDQEWGFAVEAEGLFQGTVSLRNQGGRRAEIAFGAHPGGRGRGWLERACRLLLDWGFAERELASITWLADRGNLRSRRLAWRLGFDVLPGHLHQWNAVREDRHRDAWVGTLTAQDPRSPRTRWLEAPRIESAALPVRLRPAGEADLPRVVEGCSDPETRRWLGGLPTPYTAADAADFLLRREEEMALDQAVHVALAHADDDRLLGVASLRIDRPLSTGELGYWTHPDARGRGWTTEGVRLLARHAFVDEPDGGLGLVALTASAAVDNLASRGVLDQAGFAEVGRSRSGSLTSAGLAPTLLFERPRE